MINIDNSCLLWKSINQSNLCRYCPIWLHRQRIKVSGQFDYSDPKLNHQQSRFTATPIEFNSSHVFDRLLPNLCLLWLVFFPRVVQLLVAISALRGLLLAPVKANSLVVIPRTAQRFLRPINCIMRKCMRSVSSRANILSVLDISRTPPRTFATPSHES